MCNDTPGVPICDRVRTVGPAKALVQTVAASTGRSAVHQDSGAFCASSTLTPCPANDVINGNSASSPVFAAI